ncbi:hypothetical protein CRG98_029965 [Punica granatum]|uniref:dihydrofolate reductase n=1 Tax=Punica granatum TaxID=22663 RepID=A0A2I0J053_PUNGR|nr:hypothetical protein CRG98_029965 [Punica granatum]
MLQWCRSSAPSGGTHVRRLRSRLHPSIDLLTPHRWSYRKTFSTMPRTTATVSEGGAGDLHAPRRSYQVVVAATRDMGIGKDGKLPWKLPRELKFFKELTSAVADPGRNKRNAVLMGRRTWESIPRQFQPLPGRLNVVLTRSGIAGVESTEDVLLAGSVSSALELLSASPYCSSIESVFVIGGGEILREALDAQLCDAIHITEIETDIDCDTYIPAIDLSVFKPWYSSLPVVENNIRYSFVTYIRVRNSPILESQPLSGIEKFNVECFSFLPKMILERHDEFAYLKLVQEVLSSGTRKVDRTGTGLMSKFGLQMRFNLRKSFPLLTTKRLCWQWTVDEFLKFISGSTNVKLYDAIDKIMSCTDDQGIILLSYNPLSDTQSDSAGLPYCPLVAQFYVSNGEVSCRAYQESVDVALDLPYSIASCALLTCTIAHFCGLRSSDLIQAVGDAYVSDCHILPLQEQLERLPRPFPSLKIDGRGKDIGSLTAIDFELMDYHPCS